MTAPNNLEAVISDALSNAFGEFYSALVIDDEAAKLSATVAEWFAARARKTVYVVREPYEEVHGVFSTEESAKAFIAAEGRLNDRDYWYAEAFELDAPASDNGGEQ